MRTPLITVAFIMILSAVTQVNAGVKKIDAPFVYARDLISRCGDYCEVQVAKSPAPGQRSTIYAKQVITSLDAAGFSVAQSRLPKSFKVIRASKSVGAEQMTDAAREAIMNVLPEGVMLENMGKVTGGEVPSGSWETQAIYDASTGYQQTRSIPVMFLDNGVPFRKAYVLCRLTYMVQVPVAVMEIGQNEIIQSSAIEMRSMKMGTPLNHALLNVNEIVGRKSRGVIVAGSPFESRNLIEIPIVRKGDAITVISDVNGIRITARGFARQDAVRGKRIAVEIPTVGKVLFARVVAPGFGVVQQ